MSVTINARMNDTARKLLQEQEDEGDAVLVRRTTRQGIRDMAADGGRTPLAHWWASRPPVAAAGRYPHDEPTTPVTVRAKGVETTMHIPIPHPGRPYWFGRGNIPFVAYLPEDEAMVRNTIDGAATARREAGTAAVDNAIRIAPKHLRKHGPFTASELLKAVGAPNTGSAVQAMTKALAAGGYNRKVVGNYYTVTIWYK